MRLDEISDGRFQSHFLARELEIVQKVKHPNVARVFEVLSIGQSRLILSQLYECDLLQYIEKRGCVTERVARRLLLEIASAVVYLHDLNIGMEDLLRKNKFIIKPLSAP